MEAKIQPYQYHFIKKQVLTLVEAYQHVSDLTTLQALQSITADRIHEIVGHDYPEIANLIHTVSDITLRKNTANTILANFKDFVIPFEIPSKARLSKLFAKTKKLNVPDFAQQLDPRDLSYLGWNDPGQKQKFITAYHDDTLIGVQGHLAT
ncbi:hypothetical protein ACNAN0_12920 [Agrilactobacillus fermenti]|uniref:hypothetical protein n=1 Tax=Agrilactobacillus fermenti TaxID=2586909 RepID=UPI003A5BF3FA